MKPRRMIAGWLRHVALRVQGMADYGAEIAEGIKRFEKQNAQTYGYIVGERGPELFVPVRPSEEG